MFTQAQNPKLDDTSLDSDTMFTQEDKEDSDLEMFSSQCQSPQTEREKELDMQFDVSNLSISSIFTPVFRSVGLFFRLNNFLMFDY